MLGTRWGVDQLPLAYSIYHLTRLHLCTTGQGALRKLPLPISSENWGPNIPDYWKASVFLFLFIRRLLRLMRTTQNIPHTHTDKMAR